MSEFRIASIAAADGYRFSVRLWENPAPVVRTFFLHGIMSHGGWYGASCGRLAEAGAEVHFLDRRGSGLNRQGRGEIDRFETWVRDVGDYLRQFRESPVPLALAGISWGGKLAAAVAKRYPELIDALVLICPGIHALRGPNLIQRNLVRLLDRTPLRSRRTPIPLQDSQLFTDVPSWQKSIDEDPLVLREVTLHFARENLALDEYVRDAAPRITVPTLLMLAGRDRIIDNGRTREFFHRLAGPKKLIEYPTAAHTFEFEPDPRPYFSDLTDWIIAKGLDGQEL